ncbi:hypothetical protein GCM10010518_07350 [Kitasatospora cinereorecta]
MVHVGQLGSAVPLEGDEHPAVVLADESEQCCAPVFDVRHADSNVRARRRIPHPPPVGVTSCGVPPVAAVRAARRGGTREHVMAFGNPTVAPCSGPPPDGKLFDRCTALS